MKFAVVALLLFLFRPFLLFSQSDPRATVADLPLRVELPAQSVNETYRIMPVGKAGVILFYRSRENIDGSNVNWYFVRYDTNLIQVWIKPVPIPSEHNFLSGKFQHDTLSLLFAPFGKAKSSDDRVELMRISPAGGTLALYGSKTEMNATIVDFGVGSGVAWIGYNLSSGQAGKIVALHLKTGYSRAFILGTGSSLSLMSLQPQAAGYMVDALVSKLAARKMADYFLVRYDTLGKLVSETVLGAQPGDWPLVNTAILNHGGRPEMITGTYYLGAVAPSPKGDKTPEITGFFSCPVIDSKQPAIRYYNFLEFKNAEAFIGEKDIQSIKKKALKKKKPLNEYSLDYQLIFHEPMRAGSSSILTAEVYSPEYHSENFTDFDFYGRPYTNSYSVFDGYRFSNAIVACMDLSGNILWDNNLELRNLISMELTPKVNVFPVGDNYVLFYLSDGKIASKIIHENSVVEKTDFTQIDLMYPEDKLVSENKEKVEKWYENYFIASGFQEIKNIAREKDNKRLVFYFSKIKFEP